jgi:hypothetical protein
MGWNEIPHDPRHLGVLSGMSKMIFEPAVRSAQTVHLSCVKIGTISKWTKSSFHLSSPRSTIGWVHNDFLSLWYIWCKPCTYLVVTLTLSPNGWKRDSTLPTSLRRSIGCVQNDFLCLWYIQPKPCTYLASRLALSPKGSNWASSWAMSLRSSIGCVQNDFWAYGSFGAHFAPILHRY